MNTDRLQAAMQMDSFLTYVEAAADEYRRDGRIMGVVGLTPDSHYSAEVREQRVFGSSEDARYMSRSADVFTGSVLVGIMLVFPLALAFVNVVGDNGWALLAAGLTGLIGFPYLVSRVSARVFRREGHNVTLPMVTAWTRARRVLEEADEESTAPAILNKMQELHAELNTIAATYDGLVSGVEREQAEADFLFAAAMVSALEEVATHARAQLYSGNRARLLASA